MNRRGVSLLEIIVSAIILSLVMAGLVSTFISGKRWLAYNRAKMTGGELGKYFLDPLAIHVRQDRWDDSIGTYGDYTNDLKITTNGRIGDNVGLGIKTYTPTYTVRTIPGLDAARYPQARKVKVDIAWPPE